MTDVAATVILHEILAGSNLDGAAPSGAAMVDSGETLYRGRYRKYTDCQHGGLFPVPAHAGAAMLSVHWKLPGATAVNIYLVDDDGVEYLLENSTNSSDSHVAPSDKGYQIPPTWKIKVVGTTVAGLTADGRCAVFFIEGWMQMSLDQAPLLGDEARPPAKVMV